MLKFQEHLKALTDGANFIKLANVNLKTILALICRIHIPRLRNLLPWSKVPMALMSPPMVAGDINESRLTGFWRLVEYLSGWQKNPNEYNVHVRRSWKKSLFVPSKFIVICYILQMNSGQLPSPTPINPAMEKKLYKLWNTTMQNFSM